MGGYPNLTLRPYRRTCTLRWRGVEFTFFSVIENGVTARYVFTVSGVIFCVYLHLLRLRLLLLLLLLLLEGLLLLVCNSFGLSARRPSFYDSSKKKDIYIYLQ